MKKSEPFYLLPWVFKYLSLVLLIPGVILFYIRFIQDIEYKFLDWKVFAIHSKFIETKSWTFIQNNMSEEIIGIFLLVGLYFLAFSREKVETEKTNEIRLQSFLLTIFINTILLVLSNLLFFGFSFLWVIIVDPFAVFIIYFIIFRIKYSRMLHSY
jgi:hypothetical protein